MEFLFHSEHNLPIHKEIQLPQRNRISVPRQVILILGIIAQCKTHLNKLLQIPPRTAIHVATLFEQALYSEKRQTRQQHILVNHFHPPGFFGQVLPVPRIRNDVYIIRGNILHHILQYPVKHPIVLINDRDYQIKFIPFHTLFTFKPF